MKTKKVFMLVIFFSILIVMSLLVFAEDSKQASDFQSNGDLIESWYWLRDSALQNYAEWTFDNIPLGPEEITVQINALATDRPGGDGGFNAKFLLDYSLRGEGDIPQTLIPPQTVTLENVPSPDDPLGYSCQGQVTIPASTLPAASRISLRIKRDSAQDNHIAFKEDSIVLLTDATPPSNGDPSSNDDNFEGAVPIQSGTCTGSLGEEDEEGNRDNDDYYSIDLEDGQQIALQLTVPGNAQFGISLLNPNRNSQGSSIAQREIITLDYVANTNGTWYIRVHRSSGEGEYQLVVNSTSGGSGGGVNHPPVISIVNPAYTSLEINRYVPITCNASDQDGDTLTFSWTANGVSVGENDSFLTWRAPDTTGTYTITCTVSDGRGGEDSESVNITVTSPDGGMVNHPPVISSVNAAQESIEINHNVDITCNASDQDGDTLTFSWTVNGQVIGGNNLAFSWRAPATTGTYTITCTVSDGRGGEDSETVSITVTKPSGPISTDDIIYLNSSHQIGTADFADSGGSSSLLSSGWSDYNKANRSCRAYSLGAGAVFTGGSASYWSKVGKIFDVQQGTYASISRAATITINGNYSGRIFAAILSSSDANLKVVVTDNGTVVANSELFNKSATVVDWDNFSGSFSKSLSITLQTGHTYCVYLHLETSATAAIAGSAGADVGEGGKYAGYGGIDISF